MKSHLAQQQRFLIAWGKAVREGDDADRQRLLDDFIREYPQFELRTKVFFELEYRVNHGQSVEAVATYARHVLSLPAAGQVDPTDELALSEYVSSLLRIGLQLSNGDPGRRAAVGRADPRLAALAIEAFQRVERFLQEHPALYLAQFDILVANALLDCSLFDETLTRARRALHQANCVIVGPDQGVRAGEHWANLRREAEALIAAAETGG